ncbi:hypothetical protein JL721_8319 [Aureococcus anophagefferens]|nr:hypothetical protein JL721_8319 [Aureococcus anophagefferens]
MRRAAASGGSEEAARDTARPRTGTSRTACRCRCVRMVWRRFRALAAASANTAERRVQKKNIQFDAAQARGSTSSTRASPTPPGSGYAAKGGTGADYGRYWITARGSEYLLSWTAPTSPAPTPTRIWT